MEKEKTKVYDLKKEIREREGIIELDEMLRSKVG